MVPRNTAVGPRSKRAVTGNPHIMTRPNVPARGTKPGGAGQGMLNGRSASVNVVNRYLICFLPITGIIPENCSERKSFRDFRGPKAVQDISASNADRENSP